MSETITLPESELFIRYAVFNDGYPASFDRDEYDQIEEGGDLTLWFEPAYAEIDMETRKSVNVYPPREEREFTVAIQKVKTGELLAEMALRRQPNLEDKPFIGVTTSPTIPAIHGGDSLLVVANDTGSAQVANISRKGLSTVLASYTQTLRNFGIR